MRIRFGWRRRGPGAGIAATLVFTASFGLAPVDGAPGAASPQWLMYGHDSAHTGRSPVSGPVTAHLACSYDLPVTADNNASPVVGPDGTIYMTTNNGFFAINPDCTLKWKKWVGTFDNIWEAPAVAPNGKAVYVWQANFGGGRLYALSPADGSVLWSYNVGFATYGSPTIGPDGTIYIGAQSGTNQYGNLFAIDPNGTKEWVWHGGLANCWIETSAAIGPDGTIYIQHNCRDLVALTPTETTATVKWTKNVGQEWDSPSVGPDGTVYIGNSDFFFYAYNPDGTRKWRVPVRAWMYMTSSAISADGSAIYRGDNSGNFYDVSSSGHILWRFQPADHGPVLSAPLLSANGLVYYGQETQKNSSPSLFALQASTGRVVWDYPVGRTDASPALGPDGTLYMAGPDPARSGRETLYAFH